MLVVFATDVQCSSTWHRLIGINDKIGNDLTDLTGVDFCLPQVGTEAKFAPAMRTSQRETNRVLNETANGRHLFDGRTAASEGEQLLRKIARPQ